MLGTIEPFCGDQEDQVIKLFAEIQEATSGTYPPKAILDHHYRSGGIGSWLAKGSNNQRLVFNLESGGTLVAHLEIEDLRTASDRSYWREAFPSVPDLDELAVIKRFGVAPDFQGMGVGRQMLRAALRIIDEDLEMVPGLVVVEELTAAQALYASEGGRCRGQFFEHPEQRMLSYLFDVCR